MNRATPKHARHSGFTLIETLVALVILAVGIVSILLLFPVALERQRVSTLRTMTTTVSQTLLGAMRAKDTDVEFHDWRHDNRFHIKPEADPEGYYVRSWVVSTQPMGEIGGNLHRVTVGLRLWDGRTEYYTTYVTDR